MNRLQEALLEGAFRLVAEGYASVEDIDIGLRDGLALRWSFIGPFEDPLTKENGRSHAH
jgi:L-gulonate 3-dehydrogenase